MVCLHGGGWVSGDRKEMERTIDALARRGYVAIAPDYRLAPKHRFPACIEDCKAAVRWLRANAGKYHIDPNRIGVMGMGAGGHLACLLGVTTPSDGLDGSGDQLLVGRRGNHYGLGQFGAHRLGQPGHVGVTQGTVQLVGECAERQPAVAVGVLCRKSWQRLCERRIVIVEPLELEQLG